MNCKFKEIKIFNSVLCLLWFFSFGALAGEQWQILRKNPGEAGEVCQALQVQMNSMKVKNKSDFIKSSCASVAARSFSGFADYTWREIEPEGNEHLLFELLRYASLGGNSYFARSRPRERDDWRDMSEDERKAFNEQKMEDAKRFIADGGRMFFLNARLVSDFGLPAGGRIPPGNQNVIQLRYKNEWKEINKKACPDLSDRNSFASYLFFVDEQLLGPDPRFGRTADDLLGSTPMLFEGRPIFLAGAGGNTVTLAWDKGTGPYEFCEIQFK